MTDSEAIARCEGEGLWRSNGNVCLIQMVGWGQVPYLGSPCASPRGNNAFELSE